MSQRSVAASLAVAALSLAGCNTPTQITVFVTTDVPCANFRGASIIVATQDKIDNPKPLIASTSHTCRKLSGSLNEVGKAVIVPSGDKDAQFAVKVAGGIDIDSDKCAEEVNAPHCIIARRALSFIPHTELHLPIFLSSSCAGVPCRPGKNETCSLGVCVSSIIEDPMVCELETACSDDVLTGGSGPTTQEPIACGRPTVLADDFASEKPLPRWAVEGYVKGASQADGVLALTPPADGVEPTEVRYRSQHAVNLDSDAITVEVRGIADPSSTFRAYLGFELDDKNQIRIEERDGQISFLSTPSMGGDLTGPSFTYEPKKHVFWEIRSGPQNIVLRTSPDGVDWDLGATVPRENVAHFIANGSVVLGAGVDEAAPVPGKVSFDNLNQGRLPVVWCPIDAIADSFDSPAPLPRWRVDQSSDCVVTHEKGELVFSKKGDDATDCTYQSRSAFDITGKSVILNISSLTAMEPETNVVLSVEDDQLFAAELGVRVSTDSNPDLFGKQVFYVVRRAFGGAQFGVENPTPGQIRYIRIRELGKMVYWETSPDGKIWTEQFKDSPPFDRTAVHVAIRLESYVASALTVKMADLTVKSSTAP